MTTVRDTQETEARPLWEEEAKPKASPETLLARRLAGECLDDMASRAAREVQESLLPQMELEPTPFDKARAFYAVDSPGKVLVPAEYLEIYRRRALAEHCSPGIVLPVDVDEEDADVAVAREQRIDEMTAAELADRPTQRVFPWAHYSVTADAYVVNHRDLAVMFEADIDYYYFDDPENPENKGK